MEAKSYAFTPIFLRCCNFSRSQSCNMTEIMIEASRASRNIISMATTLKTFAMLPAADWLRLVQPTLDEKLPCRNNKSQDARPLKAVCRQVAVQALSPRGKAQRDARSATVLSMQHALLTLYRLVKYKSEGHVEPIWIPCDHSLSNRCAKHAIYTRLARQFTQWQKISVITTSIVTQRGFRHLRFAVQAHIAATSIWALRASVPLDVADPC